MEKIKVLSQKEGFTLIEIILAMAILGIILVAFIGAFSNGFTSILNTGNKTRAVAQAQAIVDFIYEEGTIDSAVLTTTFDIDSEVDYADLESSPYNAAKPIYYSVESKTIGTIPTEKVTVLVFYQNGNRYITLTSLIPIPIPIP